MKASILAACVAALATFSNLATAVAQEVVWVGAERFQFESGAWFQLDENDEKWKVVPGSIAIRFDVSIDSTLAPLALVDSSLTLLSPRPDMGGFYRFSYDSAASPPIILENTLSAPHVVGAYLGTELKFFGEPDPYFDNQWNLAKARVDKAWEITAGDSNLTIAILDAGFQIDHEDLIESLWTNEAEANGIADVDDDNNGYVDDIHGWDFLPSVGHPNGDNNVEPVNAHDEHGTAVAGVASASTNNGKGISGAAGGRQGNRPKLLMLRMLQLPNVAPAIEYAWRAGADIINWSGGGYGDPGGACSIAIDSVYANGALVFGAIGNWDAPITVFPSTHPDVIGVGSTDENDVHVCNSARGPHLDIMAPSSSFCLSALEPYVWTTDNYDLSYDHNPGYPTCGTACAAIPLDNPKYFGKWVGTSAACPLAAAIGGLVKSHFQTLTSDQLRDRLLGSAIDLGVAGRDDEYGYGRVDAYRALTEWGTITGDVVWYPEDTADSTRYVSGDLTIASGATLTIMPGTIVKIASEDDFASGADQGLVEINVEGTLIANGTAANPIVFESWDQPSSHQAWFGFYFDSASGGGEFDNCKISNAIYGIESYVPLVVTNTQISKCYYGVFSLGGGALVQGCTLTDFTYHGIYLHVGGASTVRNTIVDGADYYGLVKYVPATLTVRTSQFKNSNVGLWVVGNAAANIDSSCSFTGNAYGARFYNTSTTPVLANSSFGQNTTTAILCDNNASPLIDTNEIFDNSGDGIYCSNGASPLIISNKIKICANAITATTNANPDVGHYPTSGGNSISHTTDTTGKYVRNLNSSGAIYAQNNCWDVNTEPCAPPANKFEGTVHRHNPECCEFPLEGLTFELPQPATGPSVTALGAVIPNPFNPATTIHYSLASQSNVEVKVYDVGGRLVTVLESGVRAAGAHSVAWNGVDRRGSPVASGIYFVRMVTGTDTFTRKMLLLK